MTDLVSTTPGHAHDNNITNTVTLLTKNLAGQEVKASSKASQDAAGESVHKAQKELQEERDRSKRLLEAARAGRMATQAAGSF